MLRNIGCPLQMSFDRKSGDVNAAETKDLFEHFPHDPTLIIITNLEPAIDYNSKVEAGQ